MLTLRFLHFCQYGMPIQTPHSPSALLLCQRIFPRQSYRVQLHPMLLQREKQGTFNGFNKKWLPMKLSLAFDWPKGRKAGPGWLAEWARITFFSYFFLWTWQRRSGLTLISGSDLNIYKHVRHLMRGGTNALEERENKVTLVWLLA
jgi:hypothetical protein